MRAHLCIAAILVALVAATASVQGQQSDTKPGLGSDTVVPNIPTGEIRSSQPKIGHVETAPASVFGAHPAPSSQTAPSLPLDKVMTRQEQGQAGLDKLTDGERQKLEELLLRIVRTFQGVPLATAAQGDAIKAGGIVVDPKKVLTIVGVQADGAVVQVAGKKPPRWNGQAWVQDPSVTMMYRALNFRGPEIVHTWLVGQRVVLTSQGPEKLSTDHGEMVNLDAGSSAEVQIMNH